MKFVIYGKDNCKFCTMAVTLLTQRDIAFSYKKLDEDFTREELLETFPSAKTFPQIEVLLDYGIEYVGGYNELVEYFSQIGD